MAISDPEVLFRAMRGLDRAGAKHHARACNDAMLQGDITTRPRAQFFLAQIASESVDLRYFEEIGGPTKRYAPYYGRGPIQLTWESNYRDFGRWCKERRLIDDAGVFVRHPDRVAQPKWGWLAAIYYWQTRNLNHHCDHGDFRGLTRAINGAATWGYPSHYGQRLARLAYVKRLGRKLLPAVPDPLGVLTRAERSAVRRLNALRARANRPPEDGGGWGSLADPRSRKSRAKRIKAVIRKVLMPRIIAAATATGWDRGHRRERYELLAAAVGETVSTQTDPVPDGTRPAPPDTEPDGTSPAPPDADPDTPPPYPGQPLAVGSTGEAVRTWQGQMRRRGWTIDVDGAYGPGSERVCRAFQEEKKLEVDGEVGPRTWEVTWSAPTTEEERPPEGSIAGKGSKRP